MNRHARLLAVALAITSAATPALAYDLVQNGGFETASLSSWTPFSQGASGGTGSWYAKSSGNGTYSNLPISPPPAGSWEAVADNSGRLAAILYQDIAIPATTRATLSFTIWHGNAAPGNTWTNGSSLSPSTTNQRVRVDIVPTSQGNLITAGALQLLYQTATGTAQIVNPTVITTDVTALAGQTVRLRFALVATQGGLIAGIDQVKLDVSPYSIHPAALTGLAGSYAAWGDFNNDGQFEIAMAGTAAGPAYAGWIERYTGGAWQHMATLPPLYEPGIAPADVDGDGNLDLGIQGVANGPGFQVGVMHGDGGGGFTTTYDPIGADYGSIAWGDYDRDGDLDAILTGSYNGTISTYIGRNDGSGHLTYVPTSMLGSFSGNAIWADVPRAGQKDVAFTGSSGLEYYRSDGSDAFVQIASGLPDVDVGRVTVGDMNNDGFDDLIVVGHRNSNPPAASVLGIVFYPIWGEIMSGLDGVYLAAVTVGDFDNDGWMDVATLGTPGSGRYTRVYHNNGNGTFSDVNANLPAVYAGAIAFGDFDGDGDLDLFVQGQDVTDNLISYVAINNTAARNFTPTPPGQLYSTLGDTELLLQIGSPGSDDHTGPNELTRNFRAGTSSSAVDLIPPSSNLATGRRLVAEPGRAGLALVQRLAIDRIGHNQGVWWDAQNVDQSYVGSSWAGQQHIVLGPTIASVADIPNDQGGHVRVNVQKSPFDDASRSIYQTSGYNLWRLVPPGSLAARVAREGRVVDATAALPASLEASGASGARQAIESVRGTEGLSMVEWNGRVFARSAGRTVANPFGAGTWEIVGSFFALQQSSYLVATTTLADSGVGGVNDQTYMMTMHTTTPSVWFASAPATGHSVDNIAPAPPVGLAAGYHTGAGNHLSWQPAPETDFESFQIYWGSSPGFVASPLNRVASVPSPAWTDASYDSPVVYYKVSTTDHAGNESAAVAPGSTTAVGDEPEAPVAFALSAPSPNPFTEASRISYALPRAAIAKLEVFDASGRRVRTLVDGWQPAGEHAARWGGENDAGQRVKAGVYLCRFEAGEYRATRRVALLP